MRKKTRVEKISAELEEIALRARSAIDVLADEYRRDVVEPTCRKHNLDFMTGNGEMFFAHGKVDSFGVNETVIRSDHDAEQGHKSKFSYLAPLFEVLELEVGRDDYFGYYVEDVKARKAAR